MTTANRFLAPIINVANLPIAAAIEEIDAETILSDRMADFQTRADEAGFPYDVSSLETDPIKIDQETHAYRETLMRARVNSGIRAVLPAYAQGDDLSNIVARANIERLTLVPADETTGTAAVMESDASLLVRYLASFAAPAAGSVDGYTYAALTAWPYARDIAVLGPGFHGVPGRTAIYLLADDGAPISSDTILTVRDACREEWVKPLTDDVIVSAATVFTYEVDLTIRIPRGPDASTVAAAAKANVEALCLQRFGLGIEHPANAIEGAAYVSNVISVVPNIPLFDRHPDEATAWRCSKVTVRPEVVI